MKGNNRYPIKEKWKDISFKDRVLVSRYLNHGELSVIDGGILTEFENLFAKFCGTKYAVAYCNGTAALHAASFACGANRDNEFITSVYSYNGTILSLLENGTNVKLVNYENDYLTIDLDEVEKHISKDTIGLMVTHCWGNLVDYEKLAELKKKYNLKIIVDASHAHGASYKNKKVGNIDCEDIVCFSLGKKKLMSAGELGVAVTNDYELYQKLLFFGHPNRVPNALGKDSELRKYNNGIGNKFRPHSIALLLGISQIKKFSKKIRYNIETNQFLSEEINKIDGFYTLKSHKNCNRVFWKLQVFLDIDYWKGIEFNRIVQALKDLGLTLEQFHNYDLEESVKLWSHERYAGQIKNVSNKKSPQNIIVLPGYIKLSNKDIHKIINAFKVVSQNKENLK